MITIANLRSNFELLFASDEEINAKTSIGAIDFSELMNKSPKIEIHFADGTATPRTVPTTIPMMILKIRLVELYLFRIVEKILLHFIKKHYNTFSHSRNKQIRHIFCCTLAVHVVSVYNLFLQIRTFLLFPLKASRRIF